jgi:hypothetical protein
MEPTFLVGVRFCRYFWQLSTYSLPHCRCFSIRICQIPCACMSFFSLHISSFLRFHVARNTFIFCNHHTPGCQARRMRYRSDETERESSAQESRTLVKRMETIRNPGPEEACPPDVGRTPCGATRPSAERAVCRRILRIGGLSNSLQQTGRESPGHSCQG